MRVPTLLAGGLFGNGEGGGEQVLDWGTHGLEIVRRSLTEKGARERLSALRVGHLAPALVIRRTQEAAYID